MISRSSRYILASRWAWFGQFLMGNGNAFKPELPQRLREAIDAIGYGHLDKVRAPSFPELFECTNI